MESRKSARKEAEFQKLQDKLVTVTEDSLYERIFTFLGDKRFGAWGSGFKG